MSQKQQRKPVPKTRAGASGFQSRDSGSSEATLTKLAKENLLLRQKMAKIFQTYRDKRAHLISRKHKVRVTSDPAAEQEKISLTVTENEKDVPITVTNSSEERVYFTFQPFDFVEDIFTVRDCTGNAISSIEQHPLQPGESFKLNVHFAADNAGFYEQLLIFKLEKSEPSSVKFDVMYILEVNHQTSCNEKLPSAGTDTLHKLHTEEKRIAFNSQFESYLEYTVPLKNYKMPDIIERTSGCDKILQRQPLTWENYAWRFHMLLHREEYETTTDIGKFNQEEASVITHKANKNILILKLSDVYRVAPSVLPLNQVSVTTLEDFTTYNGFVQTVHEDQAYLKFDKKFPESFNRHVRCCVTFTLNRMAIRMQHRAATLVYRHKLKEFLFPTGQYSHKDPVDSKLVIQNNAEQSKAIQHILACSAKPAPYVVFGPPGTGKTVTLVQTIKEIVKTQRCNILVCAPSNSATDHLFEKILDGNIGTDNVYRMYPLSFPVTKIPQKIKEHCNFNSDTNRLEICDKDELMRYKIFATTLQSVGRLVSGGIPPSHYKYIFVDEAGQATEPECLIPVAGLVNPLKGQVVLAGDPKQLGPIIRSHIAEKHGLGVSMLERLMRDFKLYKPHRTGGFNNRFITKLKMNYRSHHAIIKIPNDLFYGGELVCSTSLEKRLYNTWELLTDKDFPVIFHGVAGTNPVDINCSSICNPAEVDILMEYLKSLISHLHKEGVNTIAPGEIGIIAPYRKQVEKIQAALQTDEDLSKCNLENILVGTVEMFQGIERNAILMSTVRSNPELTLTNQKFTLGFIRDEKRFNVAMTRARSLLIVVGDPRLLETDPVWNKLIVYCKSKNTFHGIKLPGEDK